MVSLLTKRSRKHRRSSAFHSAPDELPGADLITTIVSDSKKNFEERKTLSVWFVFGGVLGITGTLLPLLLTFQKRFVAVSHTLTALTSGLLVGAAGLALFFAMVEFVLAQTPDLRQNRLIKIASGNTVRSMSKAPKYSRLQKLTHRFLELEDAKLLGLLRLRTLRFWSLVLPVATELLGVTTFLHLVVSSIYGVPPIASPNCDAAHFVAY